MRVKSSNRVAKHGCYAHFPGTGPAGRSCISCNFVHVTEGGTGVKMRKHYRCQKWAEMMKVPLDKAKTIQPHTPACKYFEA